MSVLLVHNAIIVTHDDRTIKLPDNLTIEELEYQIKAVLT